MNKKIKITLIALGILLLVIGAVGGTWLYEKSFLDLDRHFVEAGEEMVPEDFLQNGKDKKVSFAKGSKEIDTTIPGEYMVTLKVGFFSFDCDVVVEDTTAPMAEPVTVYFEPGETVAADEFITNISDVTATRVEYVKKPDFNNSGVNEVKIRIIDEADNETIVTSKMVMNVGIREMEMEAGAPFPSIEKFLKVDADGAEFVTDVAAINTKKVGSYDIFYKVDDIEYVTKLTIKDTTPPVLELRDVTVFDVDGVHLKAFVETLSDIGNCTVVFENEVSTANIGEQIVAIIARDEAGNVTRKEARLTVIHDNVAPVLSGVADRVSYLGDEVDYFSGITVSDNHDENIQIQVSAAVDINQEGIYPLNYFASDAAGNTTNVSANLHIIKDTEPPVLYGVKDINMVLGEQTSFAAGVYAKDNRDGNVQVVVDTSAVNTEVAGQYPITFVATDSMGNTSSAGATVHIYARSSELYPYELWVNRVANVVTVYIQDESTGQYSIPYKAFVCSSGGKNTPEGTWAISDKYVWHELIGHVYGQYSCRFVGGVLFHSVPYNRMRKDCIRINDFNILGQSASHGCVRLLVEDAKWIYDNCPPGTKVIVYSDENPGPLGKPVAPVITNGIGWDPTDPDPANPVRIGN